MSKLRVRIAALMALLLPLPLRAAPPPAKDGLGVWFTSIDSQVLFDPQESRTALAFLKANGFQRAAVPLYSGGFVYWPLAQDRNPLRLPSDPRLAEPGSTIELLQALGSNGQERIGWMEFGLMAPADAAWLKGREGLLLQDRKGSTLWQESPGLNRVWLNPLQPEVRGALEDLVVDACSTLPLEAIQLDDHLGYPLEFGYDPTTLAAWRRSVEGARHPIPEPEEPAWIAWRAARVTELLVGIRAAMQRSCPHVRLSLAPNPQNFSYRHHLADWGSWLRLGLVDELVVQLYRNDLARLAWELSQPSLQKASRLVPLRIGLLAGLRTQPKPSKQLQRGLDLVRLRESMNPALRRAILQEGISA